MIILTGSSLVADAQYHNDLDIVYFTSNIGKYLVLLRYRKQIEEELENKFSCKITFSPYLEFSPSLLGNLFIGVNLLRYPRRGGKVNRILRIARSRIDKRWMLIYLFYSLAGLLSSENSRDLTKYCSMIAEAILLAEGYTIPNSWKKTIKAGLIIAYKKRLNNLVYLFSRCLEKWNYKCKLEDEDVSLIIKSFIEFETNIIKHQHNTIRNTLSNIPRRLYEIIYKKIFGRECMWIYCSNLMLGLINPQILTRLAYHPRLMELFLKTYRICKYEVPVLSPLAHP